MYVHRNLQGNLQSDTQKHVLSIPQRWDNGWTVNSWCKTTEVHPNRCLHRWQSTSSEQAEVKIKAAKQRNSLEHWFLQTPG